MIVKISKIEIVGPKDLLHNVLVAIRELGILHIAREVRQVASFDTATCLHPIHCEDEAILSQYLLHEHLIAQIETLLRFLPPVPEREVFLPPEEAIRSANRLVVEHSKTCEGIHRAAEEGDAQLRQFQRMADLLTAVGPSLREISQDSFLDFLALEIRDEESFQHLAMLLRSAMDCPFEVKTLQSDIGLLRHDSWRHCLRHHSAYRRTRSYLEKAPLAAP